MTAFFFFISYELFSQNQLLFFDHDIEQSVSDMLSEYK